MKVHLMFPDADAAQKPQPPEHARDLVADLDLKTLWHDMADGDEKVEAAARASMLHPLTDPDVIVYRQQALQDCLRNMDTVRSLYALADEARRADKEVQHSLYDARPEPRLHRALRILELLLDILDRLHAVSSDVRDGFSSAAFRSFFDRVLREIDADYLATAREHLAQLGFPQGLLVSARLGSGNHVVGLILREPRPHGHGLHRRTVLSAPTKSLTVPDQDEGGFVAMAALRNRCLADVSVAASDSADHILDFFSQLAWELAFYLAGTNLARSLASHDLPVCYPFAAGLDEPNEIVALDLYDPALCLRLGGGMVTNDLDAEGKALILVTGANQGGKSTFLRSLGLAYLLMQSGLCVPAQEFTARVATGVFTHFRREEDAQMSSGKLDEELRRMDRIADLIQGPALLLCNESFAATNEREGSEIARHVIRAMTASGVRVVLVTHLYELADGLRRDGSAAHLFLRAEREQDGRRTFRIVPGAPTSTSFGLDLYVREFGADEDRTA